MAFDSENNFFLSWAVHTEQLINYVQLLFEEENNFDCTLCADGLSLECHRLVLSACSPYLRDVIREHPLGLQNPIITLAGISKTDLNSIVEYMYTGETIIANGQLESFLDACKSIDLLGIGEYDVIDHASSKEDENLIGIKGDHCDNTGEEIPENVETSDYIKAEKCDYYEDALPLDVDDATLIDQSSAVREYHYMDQSNSCEISSGYISPPEDNIKVDAEHVKVERLDPLPMDENLDNDGNQKTRASADDVANIKKRFVCPKCGAAYSHKRTLTHHIHWICDQPATYSCPFCQYIGKRKFQLRSHVERVHKKKWHHVNDY